MVLSVISDLSRFVRRRDILRDVNGGFGKLTLSRYGSSDLALPDESWIFFLMVAARRFVLTICIPATTSSAVVIHSFGSQQRRQRGSVVCPSNISGGALADVA